MGRPLFSPVKYVVNGQEKLARKIQVGHLLSYDKDATGPKFLEDLLTGRNGVRYFDPPVFYPRTADELDQAYAAHHKARGWKDEEGLRRSLAKAEKRLLEAQREASEWRRRYEELAKQLEQ